MRLSNRYELLYEIGRGAVGVVFLAKDPRLDRNVAVKMLHPQFLNTESEERFRREALVISRFDHPSIVVVFDVGESNGSLFYVMPYVEGSNLRSMIEGKKLTIADVIEIGYQAADALEYSHSRGVIHRDIKPENILVVKQNGAIRARITDFGLAVASDQKRLTQTGKVVGTVAYLSPEQVQDQDADARSDLYSLATVLYECLAGAPPFSGDLQWLLYRIAHEAPKPLQEINSEVDFELNRIIMRCLQKDPEKRPQRAIDLAKALLKCRDAEAGRPAVYYRRSGRKKGNEIAGREQEMEALTALLAEAAKGRTTFALISGEAGIGKTRIAQALEYTASLSGFRVLYGRFAEFDHALPFPGYQEMLQQALRSQSIVLKLSGFAPELARLFPALEESFYLSSSPSKEKIEFQDRVCIFDLLTRSFSTISEEGPLCLIMEDLHDANISVELLQYWSEKLQNQPLLIVATYRASRIDRAHPLRKLEKTVEKASGAVRIELRPLTLTATTKLLHLLCGSPPDERMAGSIHEATEGNPFFIQELVKSLKDAEGIKTTDGKLTLTENAENSHDVLPLTIEQLIDQRLDSLSKDAKHVLSVASVCGRNFEREHLWIVSGSAEQTDISIDELLGSGLLVQDESEGHGQLSFGSGLVRHSVYKKIPRIRRKNLHRKYAELLENRHPSEMNPDARIFNHYVQAGVIEKIVPLGIALGAAALQRYSPEDAISAARTTIDFIDSDDPAMRNDEGKVRSILAEAYMMQSNYNSALEELEHAVRRLEETGNMQELLRLVLMAADAALDAGQREQGRRWVEYGLARAEQIQDDEYLDKLRQIATLLSEKW